MLIAFFFIPLMSFPKNLYIPHVVQTKSRVITYWELDWYIHCIVVCNIKHFSLNIKCNVDNIL